MRAEPFMPDTAPTTRWLSIVGIGEDGVEGLSASARALVANADIVFGGERHLETCRAVDQRERAALAEPVLAWHRRGSRRAAGNRSACSLRAILFIMASARCWRATFPPDETIVVPALSAFSLAAARLGWALPETALVSLHGRELDRIRPHLQPRRPHPRADLGQRGARSARAAADRVGLRRLAAYGARSAGRPSERVRSTTAETFAMSGVAALNMVAIEVEAGADARVIAFSAGLADDLFEHDGQITKREIRAITVSALAPTRGRVAVGHRRRLRLGRHRVDVDAPVAARHRDRGAPRPRRAHQPECRGARRARAPCSRGHAPEALAGLATPDAIFVGGGASETGVLDAAIAALRPGGRLVANAVTLETEAELIARHAALGGELTRIAVSRAEAVGGKTGWRPAMPVTQWDG